MSKHDDVMVQLGIMELAINNMKETYKETIEKIHEILKEDKQ